MGKVHKVEMTLEERKRYLKAVSEIVEDVAERVGVDPRGYGCYGPSIKSKWNETTQEFVWVAEWSRLDSCD